MTIWQNIFSICFIFSFAVVALAVAVKWCLAEKFSPVQGMTSTIPKLLHKQRKKKMSGIRRKNYTR